MNIKDVTTVVIEHYYNHRFTKVTDDGFRYEASESRLSHTEKFTGKLLDAFKKVEKGNERLRYCNGDYIKFADENVQKAYLAWSKGLTQSEWYDVVGFTCANTD